MLGMMNVSSDSVEFYSANSERKYTSQVSEEQTKAFTEIKKKPEISYTSDGRRLIDGKSEKEVDGVHLWHTVIKRKALSPPVFGIAEAESTEEEEKIPAVTVTEEPVVSCSPRREDALNEEK